MRTITLKLPRPHDAQREILESPARFKVACCGRRFGKTELFVQILLNGPRSEFQEGALQGYPVAYVSLTYRNVEEIWSRILGVIPPALIAHKNESDHMVKLITGGSIECWTFDNFRTSRGRAYKGIILDEAAHAKYLKEAWQDIFRAMLIDFTGWAVFGSTPLGFNYFYELYKLGQDSAHADWASWRFTSYDNPILDASEIDTIRATENPEVFDREYLALFFVPEGSAFGDIEPYINYALLDNPPTPDAEHCYVAGIDWGQEDDYTALSIWDASVYPIQEIYIDRWRKQSFNTMLDNIVSACKKWRIKEVRPEKNAFGSVIEQLWDKLQDENIDATLWPITMTHTRKNALVNTAIRAIGDEALEFYPNDAANSEMGSFVSKQLPSGIYTYDHAPGAKSDMVIARVLAINGALGYVDKY